MNIVQNLMTNNPCYKAGRKIKVRGLMLHSVGCPQPSAQAFIKIFNVSTYNSACVHAFIDANTGTVYQTLPWDHRGWHGGKGVNGCCNDTHIGVEMCEPSQIKYTTGANFTVTDPAAAKAAVKRTYDSAVELFAYLCKLYGINPLTDIVSHNEGRIKGIATSHVDPEHLWNGLNMGYTMEGFRQAVKIKMDNNKESEDEAMTREESIKFNLLVEAVQDLTEKVDALRVKTGYYNYIDSNMPKSYKPTIRKLTEKGLLQGNDEGELMLTTDMMRTLTILDRTGVFDA